MILSSLSIRKDPDGYKVINEYGVLGPMYDFYSERKKLPLSLAKNTYPFRRKKNCFKSKADAELALEETKNHVRAVLDMPVKDRSGASKWWRP
jgi:hypothetical protein